MKGLMVVALGRISWWWGLRGRASGLWWTDVLEDGLMDHTVLDGGPLVAWWRPSEVPRRQAVIEGRDEGEPEEEGHVGHLVAPHVVDPEVCPEGA